MLLLLICNGVFQSKLTTQKKIEETLKSLENIKRLTVEEIKNNKKNLFTFMIAPWLCMKNQCYRVQNGWIKEDFNLPLLLLSRIYFFFILAHCLCIQFCIKLGCLIVLKDLKCAYTKDVIQWRNEAILLYDIWKYSSSAGSHSTCSTLQLSISHMMNYLWWLHPFSVILLVAHFISDIRKRKILNRNPKLLNF